MTANPANSLITLKFLESETGLKVLRLTVKDGSQVGDNYMSVLYSIEVQVQSEAQEEETRHYLLKCFPYSQSRQQFLINANLFHKELCFYTKWAKELISFQTNVVGLTKHLTVPLAIPSFISGRAINYFEIDSKAKSSKCYSPLDNFILMTDVRKPPFGFRMPDRRKGLDVDHIKLAFSELAVMHALSWAYRKQVEYNLKDKFPFLERSVDEKKTRMWLNILADNAKTADATISSVLGADNVLSVSLSNFVKKASSIIKYFQNPDEIEESSLWKLLRDSSKYLGEDDVKSEPWRVVCHGDCYLANMLFYYDEATQKPTRVILVDFPLAKLGCPTLDLSCLIYTSTRRLFRSEHLEDCLQLYYDKFNEICSLMNVKTLPGFTVDSIQKKFHLLKLVAFLIAVISLPLNLVEKKVKADSAMEDMLKESCVQGVSGLLYQEWILELVQDMYDDGVI